MRIRSVEIVGGGPGGLYLALLLRGRAPSVAVTVHERTRPEETFGFGVGFTGATLRQLAAADPESHAALLLAAHPNPRAEFVLPSGRAPVQLRGNVAIERARLLTLLVKRADEEGVVLRWGSEPRAEELLESGSLVVAADGAGSATRERFATRLGATIEEGAGRYIWCAADTCLPQSIYATAETAAGTFVAHAYPYSADRSTFLVESEVATLAAAGLERELAAGHSDEKSLALLQEAFAEILGPARLIGNRSQWRGFRTVQLERWHDGNLVLLGDAAHTAHYSVGSGTKIAMEDSIALADALCGEPEERAAFARYEAARRPPVSRLQQISRRSQLWWEAFPRRAHLPARQLALAFLTRTGNVGFGDVEVVDPGVLAAAASSAGADGHSREEILRLPLEHARRAIDGRLIGPSLGAWRSACPVVTAEQAGDADPDPPYVQVGGPVEVAAARERFPGSILAAVLDADGVEAWAPGAEARVEAARRCLAAGCDGVHLEGAARSRSALLDRLELAERLRLETDGLVAADCPVQYVDDAVIAIAAGRVDLISLEEGSVGKEGAPRERQAA